MGEKKQAGEIPSLRSMFSMLIYEKNCGKAHSVRGGSSQLYRYGLLSHSAPQVQHLYLSRFK